LTDHGRLRGLSRLARAEHDADASISERFADVPDEKEAGVVGLHHHVEQDQGDVRMPREQCTCPFGGPRAQELEAPIGERHAPERELRDVVDLLLVVDDRNLPDAAWSRRGAVRGRQRIGCKG
jgi:hypothetical protein